MKLARALDPRATHENTLVMRSSLGGDEDQGAEAATGPDGRDPYHPGRSRDCGPEDADRAMCVPHAAAASGQSRSLLSFTPAVSRTRVIAATPQTSPPIFQAGTTGVC
jgi:hypothetical protein